MNRIYFCLIALLLCKCQVDSQLINSEVCIYGNSSASVITAIQLKKSGRKVIIVSPDKHIGGMAIEGTGRFQILIIMPDSEMTMLLVG